MMFRLALACVLALSSLVLLSSCESEPGCSNTCDYAFDFQCDDGGPGSLYSVCESGTDCADCGPRGGSGSSSGSGSGGEGSCTADGVCTELIAGQNSSSAADAFREECIAGGNDYSTGSCQSGFASCTGGQGTSQGITTYINVSWFGDFCSSVCPNCNLEGTCVNTLGGNYSGINCQ